MDIICDLQERILWIGEDEAGNVFATAASKLLCSVSRSKSALEVDQYEEDTLCSVFLGGGLVRAVESGTETVLELRDNRRIIIPIPVAEIFNYSYYPQNRKLYILGLDAWLSCCLSENPEIKVYNIDNLGEIPQYEVIKAYKEGVIICQYGLIICPNEGTPLKFDPVRYPYCEAAFLSDDTVIAALENSAIHYIQTRHGVIDEIPAPQGRIYYLEKFGNGAVMLWNEDNPESGARKLYGARIVGRQIQQVCFGDVSGESFAIVPEEGTVFIGSLQGLIRWKVSGGVFEKAQMPNQERIVQLFWSHSMQRLFIGCRHGEVYKTKLDFTL